tara:strand:+ start:672 stop:896 length:225 start_codon:yes stop_codon:yes gene_type:complete
MKYLLFNTKEGSLERSSQEAMARGCSGSSTKYWWDARVTKAGKWALCIDDTTGLTPAEMSQLKDSVIWPDPPTP